MFHERLIDLPHMVVVTLIKVKVLQVLFTHTGSPDGSTAQTLGLGLRFSTIAKNSNVVNCGDGWLEIVKLKAQIRASYEAVHKLNPHFWPALVSPDEHLNAKPMMLSIGSVEQMQMTWNLTYEAWHEVPGAIAVIEMAIEGDLRSRLPQREIFSGLNEWANGDSGFQALRHPSWMTYDRSYFCTASTIL
ncbi:hypothetical protein PENCOP_c010G02377 [Penicillium coprophilum]|uniref:Uncharacterized protein n=1 Tax=Penicillium coprophilum TaxID=36646 RepID=A0A1V6UFZ0_9EURO|nr:hypothetical protein PENCOP_c010G02377 [Penicillium coprophilum]